MFRARPAGRVGKISGSPEIARGARDQIECVHCGGRLLLFKQGLREWR